MGPVSLESSRVRVAHLLLGARICPLRLVRAAVPVSAEARASAWLPEACSWYLRRSFLISKEGMKEGKSEQA